MTTTLRELQRHAVDSIKRRALTMSLGSPGAQKQILTEYLWTEEGAESEALQRVTEAAPEWLDKLVTRQLDDERRHAALLRTRLVELGVDPKTLRPPPSLVRVKLWWLERTVAPFMQAFAAGPIVVMLAIAAQLEATGVRMFSRHLAVLEQHAADDPTTAVIRSILGDEKRHAKSCAAAVERLVRDTERATLADLRERVARIDRAFGVTISLGFLALVASHAVIDRARSHRMAGRTPANHRMAGRTPANHRMAGRTP
ncbi:MAG: ferritin-like domain-containing protein, partial [Kofleriaceae bacterium]